MLVISEALALRLREAEPDEALDIVVELAPTHVAGGAAARDAAAGGGLVGEGTAAASRANTIDERKAAFTERSEPLEHEIVTLGGEVLGRTWLNETLRAMVPADAVRSLGTMDGIALLDVPRDLVPDQVQVDVD